MYVALTRGRNDQRTYTIAPTDQHPEPSELPVVADERSALDALSDSLSRPKGADLASVADPNAAAIAEQAKHALDSLGGRALGLAETRVAAQAINNPDPVTVAALGPRPAIGEHRQQWDAAVGQAAIYRTRCDNDAITIDGSVAPASPVDGPKRYDDYDRVQTAVRRADIERLARTSLPQLLNDRSDAQAALAGTPEHDNQRATDAANAAEDRLSEARAQLDITEHSYERAQPRCRGQRRDPNTVESARRDVADATRTVATAEANLARATQQLKASAGNNVERDAVQARIAAIDRSVDRRITTAVKRPACYISETVGKRPTKTVDAKRWDKAARTIETYRHRHLGLTPNDGPQAETGTAGALGPRPSNLVRLMPWKKAHDQLEQHLAQPLHQEQPLQRTR